MAPERAEQDRVDLTSSYLEFRNRERRKVPGMRRSPRQGWGWEASPVNRPHHEGKEKQRNRSTESLFLGSQNLKTVIELAPHTPAEGSREHHPTRDAARDSDLSQARRVCDVPAPPHRFPASLLLQAGVSVRLLTRPQMCTSVPRKVEPLDTKGLRANVP